MILLKAEVYLGSELEDEFPPFFIGSLAEEFAALTLMVNEGVLLLLALLLLLEELAILLLEELETIGLVDRGIVLAEEVNEDEDTEVFIGRTLEREGAETVVARPVVLEELLVRPLD
jgi:hypothetical protein